MEHGIFLLLILLSSSSLFAKPQDPESGRPLGMLFLLLALVCLGVGGWSVGKNAGPLISPLLFLPGILFLLAGMHQFKDSLPGGMERVFEGNWNKTRTITSAGQPGQVSTLTGLAIMAGVVVGIVVIAKLSGVSG